MKEEAIVISLGGSLIVPDDVDVQFLIDFKDFVLKEIEKGRKFIIITGGGKVARKYLDAAHAITGREKKELEMIGIYGTRLNAELLRCVFGDLARSDIILD